jgi:hypothetical protein
MRFQLQASTYRFAQDDNSLKMPRLGSDWQFEIHAANLRDWQLVSGALRGSGRYRRR